MSDEDAVVKSEVGNLSAPEVTKKTKYDTVVSGGQAALKALLTLNGAAAIAFLGFMGVALQRIKMDPSVLDYFIEALWGFILGAFAAVLSAGAIFVTTCFSYVEWNKTSNAFFGVTCAIGIVAFGCFIYGGVKATEGFRQAGAAFINASPISAADDRRQ